MGLRVFNLIRRPRWIDAIIDVSAILAVVLIPISIHNAIVRRIGPMPLAGVLLLLGAMIAAMYPLHRLRKRLLRPFSEREKVAVGADGVRITWFRRRRFVPYADIRAVRVIEVRKQVVIEHGEEQLAFRPEDPKAVARAIEEGRAAWQAAEAVPALRAFDAEGDDLERWRDAARAAADGGLRDEAATPERLVALAEDPRSAPSQRVAAALALATAREPLRVRVRVAAESTASPDLAEAMKKAVEGDIDVGTLERALR